MKLTGAEIFIECLKREGVKTLFALPGGVVSRFSTCCISRRTLMSF